MIARKSKDIRPASGIPSYEPMLRAYHTAFRPTLQEMVDSVPVPRNGKVLDLACGDGVYSNWFMQRLEGDGSVLAVDACEDYLRLAAADAAARIAFCTADAGRLPFPDDTFDLAWCAQSLYSLPHARVALSEMLRILKPGGTLAILENDTLHHVLLPWPVELELAIRVAEFHALSRSSANPAKFYFGRNLATALRSCGATSVTAKAWATTRQAPLGLAEKEFLSAYLQCLRLRIAEALPPAQERQFQSLIDPENPDSLLNREDFVMTCLDHLVWGIKPRRA